MLPDSESNNLLDCKKTLTHYYRITLQLRLFTGLIPKTLGPYESFTHKNIQSEGPGLQKYCNLPLKKVACYSYAIPQDHVVL